MPDLAFASAPPQTPPSLAKPTGYSYSHQATEFGFGQCPFSRETQNCRIEADLYYIDTLLCDEDDLATVRQILQANAPAAAAPFLLMVNRGECPFVTKARNAQSLADTTRAEIAGLVIATQLCQCLTADGTCATPVDSDTSAGSMISCNHEIANVDEEDTSTIYLPSVVLELEDADLIKQELMMVSSSTTTATGTDSTESPVRMELTWEAAPVQTDTVVFDFWHLPSPYRTMISGGGSSQRRDIPYLLGQVLEPFSNRVQFTPKFYVVSELDLVGCNPDELGANDGNANANICLDQCTNNGRYCAEDPEKTLGEGVSGANLVEESLRRMCIWDLYGSNETDPIGVIWWKYLDAFQEACTVEDYRPSEDPDLNKNLLMDDTCSRAAMIAAGVSYISVSRCIISSGGTTENKENELLEASLREREANAAIHTIIPPTLIINDIPFRGKTLSESFGAICASYASDDVPDACRVCANCADEQTCLVNGGVCSEEGGQLAAPTGAPSAPSDQGSSQPEATPPSTLLSPSPDSSGDNLDISSSSPTDPLDGNESGSGEGSNDSENSGGLSDTTKMVVVVAVVGGAIVVIFAFVMVLVWKLLNRIRHLEGKGKHTPTTSSPAGSGIWKLPYYVTTKEDPFNSEFEPLPDAGVEAIPDAASEGTLKEERQVIPPAVDVATATDVTPGEELHEHAAVETKTGPTSNDQIQEEKKNINQGTLKEQTISELTVSTTSGSVSDDQSSAASKRDEEKGRLNGNTTPDRSKPKSRRSKQGTSSLLDIMGKAAPEAKISRSFSYEDEEKEEIEEIRNEGFLGVE